MRCTTPAVRTSRPVRETWRWWLSAATAATSATRSRASPTDPEELWTIQGITTFQRAKTGVTQTFNVTSTPSENDLRREHGLPMRQSHYGALRDIFVPVSAGAKLTDLIRRTYRFRAPNTRRGETAPADAVKHRLFEVIRQMAAARGVPETIPAGMIERIRCPTRRRSSCRSASSSPQPRSGRCRRIPGGAAVNGFQRCAVTGFVLGVLLAALLGPPVWLIAVLAGVGVATGFAVVLVTRLLTGRATLVYRHHALAVLAASAGVLAIAGHPVLAGLDAVALGLGVMLAVGRVGCLRAGCCHGRPAARGVRYDRTHLDGTFPEQLAGVRLFPVQALEAGLVLAVVAGGVAIVRGGAAPGAAFAWFVSATAVARFGLSSSAATRSAAAGEASPRRSGWRWR